MLFITAFTLLLDKFDKMCTSKGLDFSCLSHGASEFYGIPDIPHESTSATVAYVDDVYKPALCHASLVHS